MIEIIDVEQVLSDIIGTVTEISKDIKEETTSQAAAQEQKHILVVDDSSVARNQIKRTLDQVGYTCTLAKNGKEGLDQLKQWATEGPIGEKVAMVISDIEMPVMDGYTFTTEGGKDHEIQGV